MSDSDDRVLPPDVEAVVGHERPVPELDPELHARMKARLRAAIGGGDPGDGGEPPSGGPPASGGAAFPGLAGLAAGIALGGALGVLGTLAWVEQRAPEELVLDSPAPAVRAPEPQDPPDAPAEPFAPPSPEEESVEEPAPAPAPATPARAPHARRRAVSADHLAVERRMLDSARAAIRRGDREDGIRALDRHARRFPDGELAEEREALRIRALLDAGRVHEAEERARAFHERHPDSLLWMAIRARLERAHRAAPEDAGRAPP